MPGAHRPRQQRPDGEADSQQPDEGAHRAAPQRGRGQSVIMVNTEGELLIFARVLSGHFANFSLAIVLVITTLGHSDGGHQSCHETSAVFMLN